MYSYVIDGMTWSYSRIRCFHDCPYQFFLKYIYGCQEIPQFFSTYGSFIHGILARLYGGKISREEAYIEYLCEFGIHVIGFPPSEEIRKNFRNDGEAMFGRLPSVHRIIGIEKKLSFKIDGIPFIGFVDMIAEGEDGSIEIWDHKSHLLKPRSARKKRTKSDTELDEYLIQLYLYSIPVKRLLNQYPDRLVFHCYRSGSVIKEPFSMDKMKDAKKWATDSVQEIRKCQRFIPKPEYFKCRYLCGVSCQCEYFSSSF